MMHAADRIEAEALDWLVRTGDPAFDDWDTFTAWLEADPAHAARYQALAADMDEMAGLVPPAARPLAAPAVARPTRRRWIGGAIAATLVATIGVGGWQMRDQPYAVETARGVTRTVTLADGSRIALNGDTRLILDRRDIRMARLERGQALFTIRHDAARPFRVTAGDNELVDLGTVFDVVHGGGETRVAVSEGAVMFNPDGEKVRLDPGRALIARGNTVSVAQVDPSAVGAWKDGLLVYFGSPLGDVATDLSRALGLPVAASPAVAARPFHGVVQLEGLGRDPARIGDLLGVTMARDGDAWVMMPAP